MSSTTHPDEAARLRDLAYIVHLRRAGDPAYRRAVQAFAAKNLGLAYRAAERWRSATIPQADVQGAAIVGLLEAIRDWDPARVTDADHPFAAYAYNKMRYHLQRQKEGPLVPISRPLRDLKRKAERAIAAARTVEHRDLEIEEIAATLLCTVNRLRDALDARSVTAPTDAETIAAPQRDDDDDPVRAAMVVWVALPQRQRRQVAEQVGAPIRNGDKTAAWGRRIAAWLARDPKRCAGLVAACQHAATLIACQVQSSPNQST